MNFTLIVHCLRNAVFFVEEIDSSCLQLVDIVSVAVRHAQVQLVFMCAGVACVSMAAHEHQLLEFEYFASIAAHSQQLLELE